MKAYEMARQLMLQTHSEQIAEYTGDQFEMVVAQIARENELKESLGLVEDLEEPVQTAPDPDPDQDEGSEAQPRRP
jgi:capsid protein